MSPLLTAVWAARSDLPTDDAEQLELIRISEIFADQFGPDARSWRSGEVRAYESTVATVHHHYHPEEAA
jgi:hypothetical protein